MVLLLNFYHPEKAFMGGYKSRYYFISKVVYEITIAVKGVETTVITALAVALLYSPYYFDLPIGFCTCYSSSV